MSVFNEILRKVNDLSNSYVRNIKKELEDSLALIDAFEQEYLNERKRTREKSQKEKNVLTTLQSINEDEDDSKKPDDNKNKTPPIPILENGTSGKSSNESTSSQERRSKKRSKNEVDGVNSPAPDKRQKRNASVKAKNNIAKQVNLNLNQKLRRDASPEKSDKSPILDIQPKNDEDKENSEPIPVIQIKLERITMPAEPQDSESLSVNIGEKQNVKEDAFAMPPPAAPLTKTRRAVRKEKSVEDPCEDETSDSRRSTRTRKLTEKAVAEISSRATRASSRSIQKTQTQDDNTNEGEARPKRTRAKKKISESASNRGPETIPDVESASASPAEKPRPKRTRRANNKQEKKEEPKPEEELLSPKEERISVPEVLSPILQTMPPKTNMQKEKQKDEKKNETNLQTDLADLISQIFSKEEVAEVNNLDVTKVVENHMEAIVPESDNMDKTVVLPKAVYNHETVTPKNIRTMNETVVLGTCDRETIVIEKPQQNTVMDATVVITKDGNGPEITDDISVLTDDSASPQMTAQTPPKQSARAQNVQPTSAVKEKVQQFEELATRVTRTKTRAMAKKDPEPENHTPPDKVSKAILPAETLAKMNAMIFNGKPLQVSSSASKPRVAVNGGPYANAKANAKPGANSTASASKLSGLVRGREAEEALRKEKEDARAKKEALIEAKKEFHRKKREEKMAAAAAAREAAERERRLAAEALERERRDRQAQAEQGRADRLREADKKKQEQARKMAETERRKAEERAKAERLAQEKSRAEAHKKRQADEAEALKKVAAKMEREMEKKNREYKEKQKLKHRLEEKLHTPMRVGNTPPMEPVYMEDGFQYLNSDEEEEPVERPVPEWSSSKARRYQLGVQCHLAQAHVDRLFSVRTHSPDLREIFPNIDRARLKRTSSAVWRTPPTGARLPHLAEE